MYFFLGDIQAIGDNGDAIEVDAMAIWTSPPEVLEFDKNVLGWESHDFKMGRTPGLNPHLKNLQFFLKNWNRIAPEVLLKMKNCTTLVDTTNQKKFRWREIRIFIKKNPFWMDVPKLRDPVKVHSHLWHCLGVFHFRYHPCPL